MSNQRIPDIDSADLAIATKRPTFLIIFDYWAFLPFVFLPVFFSKTYFYSMLFLWFVSLITHFSGYSFKRTIIKLVSFISPKLESSERDDTKWQI